MYLYTRYPQAANLLLVCFPLIFLCMGLAGIFTEREQLGVLLFPLLVLFPLVLLFRKG